MPCFAPSIKEFALKLGEYCPVTVRQVYRWIEMGHIDTWPRIGREPYRIRLNLKLRKFLVLKGVSLDGLQQFIGSITAT